MNFDKLQPYTRSLACYCLGQASILTGTFLMDATGSMVPMALASSAALMLTAPLVRQIAHSRRSSPVRCAR